MTFNFEGSEKFKVGDKVWYAPPKGDYVTIDTCEVAENDGDFNNSAEEWCRQIHGELDDFVAYTFESYKGFIYLFSRRYASYEVDIEEYMRTNDYDAVFVNREEFYFCSNNQPNEMLTPAELYDEGVDFSVTDYGDDCLGWHNNFYVHNGKLYTLTEWQE